MSSQPRLNSADYWRIARQFLAASAPHFVVLPDGSGTNADQVTNIGGCA